MTTPTTDSQTQKILHTCPGGWDYWAGSPDNDLDYKTIENLADEFGIPQVDFDKPRDDLQGCAQFVAVIKALFSKHGFTHIEDSEALENKEPHTLEEFFQELRKGWKEEDHKTLGL